MVRLIAQVLHHRQLFCAHLRRDLLQHLGAGYLIRKLRDNHFAVFQFINGASAEGAIAALINLPQIAARRNDFGAAGEVRPLDVFADVAQCRVGIFQQMDACCDHFAQIVRRNIGGHAHGDAGAAIEQHVGHARREQHRLVEGSVEVGCPIDRALT